MNIFCGPILGTVQDELKNSMPEGALQNVIQNGSLKIGP